jgi:hypothetical protein
LPCPLVDDPRIIETTIFLATEAFNRRDAISNVRPDWSDQPPRENLTGR